MKSCKNCAWYCHADGKCYGTPFLFDGMEIGANMTVPAEDGCCRDYAFDGLQDWERESCKPETLMTMGNQDRGAKIEERAEAERSEGLDPHQNEAKPVPYGEGISC